MKPAVVVLKAQPRPRPPQCPWFVDTMEPPRAKR